MLTIEQVQESLENLKPTILLLALVSFNSCIK